jgi:hypothetical protein
MREMQHNRFTNIIVLELPEDMKIHDVFHTSLLHLEAGDPIADQADQRAPPPS